MSSDALYERIVRLIPVDDLGSSYNSVLQDEISSVSHAVDDVVAALSVAKEVQDAMTKLQGNPQHCSSLLQTMYSTLELQQELEMRLRNVMQVMGANHFNTKKKRKPVENNSEESESSNSSSDSSDSDSGANAESEVVVTHRFPFLHQPNAVRKQEIGGEHRSKGLFTDPNVLISDMEDGNTGASGATRRLNLLPPADSRETRKNNSDVQDDDITLLERLIEAFDESKNYVRIVSKMNKMSATGRHIHIRRILQDVTDVVNNYGKTKLREAHAVAIMRCVVKWPCEETDQRFFLDAYKNFLTAMTAYEAQAVHVKEKSKLQEFNAKLAQNLKQMESRAVANKALKYHQKRDEQTKIEEKPTTIAEGVIKKLDESKPTPVNVTETHQGGTTASVPAKQATIATAIAVPTPLIVITSKSLPEKLDEVKPIPVNDQGGTTTNVPVHQSVKPAVDCTVMINNLKATTMQRKVQCIPHILLQLKKAMLEDEDGHQKWQIPAAIAEVLEWITKGFDFRHDFNSYHEFAIVLFSYAARHPEAEVLQRISGQFSEDVDKIRSEASLPTLYKCIPKSPPSLDEAMDPNPQEDPAVKSTRQNLDAGLAKKDSKLDENADKMRKVEAESESESESESDYEDDKEPIGGSEAAWSMVITAVRGSEN